MDAVVGFETGAVSKEKQFGTAGRQGRARWSGMKMVEDLVGPRRGGLKTDSRAARRFDLNLVNCVHDHSARLSDIRSKITIFAARSPNVDMQSGLWTGGC